MDPFIGEIRIFAGNYAPVDWEFCSGQILQIAQYTALYAVIGNTYGGDGHSTFALPNLCERVTIHQGQGENLTPRAIGQTGGVKTVTLTSEQLPPHSHAPCCNSSPTKNDPIGAVWASTVGRGAPPVYNAYDENNKTNLNGAAITAAGSGLPHNNIQPVLGMNFIIATNGLFPPRPY